MQFKIERFKRELGRRTLRYKGSLLWNVVENNLKEKESAKVFKKNIKQHIDFINKVSFKSKTCILKNRLNSITKIKKNALIFFYIFQVNF